MVLVAVKCIIRLALAIVVGVLCVWLVVLVHHLTVAGGCSGGGCCGCGEYNEGIVCSWLCC